MNLLFLLMIATFGMEDKARYPRISSQTWYWKNPKLFIGEQCQNPEIPIIKQKYDRQIKSKSNISSMHKLEKNTQGFLTDERDIVKFTLVQKTNEPMKITTTEISLNYNAEHEIVEEPDKCAICLDFIENDTEKFTGDCKHLYHSECIRTWLKKHKTCPQCRNKLHKVHVWITLDEFKSTKSHALSHVSQNHGIGDAEQIADHENQQNQIQDVFPPLNEHPLQITRCEMCWYYSCVYLGWSVLEVAIVCSFIYIPQWHNWFWGMQILNGLTLLLTWFLQYDMVNASSEWINLTFNTVWWIPVGLWVTTLLLTYHSVTGELLSGVNLAHVTFWPYFVLGFFPIIFVEDCYLTYNRDPSNTEFCLTASIWVVLQIGIVSGKIFVSKWVNWFGWMQGFHIASFIMLLMTTFHTIRGTKWWNLHGVWRFLFGVGLLTYHSIGSLIEVSVIARWHYFLWPWFLSVFSSWPWWDDDSLPNENVWYPGWRWQSIVYSLWALVQMGIILAKFYVPKWAIWYEFMQGFHLYAFLLYLLAWLKYPERVGRRRKYVFIQAAVLHILTSILSYHSISGLLLSEYFLIHASIWPWIIIIMLMLLKCVKMESMGNE